MALGRQSSAIRSVHLIPSKGNEPREGVFDFCCETPVTCLRTAPGVALWWMSLSTGHTSVVTARVRSASGVCSSLTTRTEVGGTSLK